MYRLTVAAAHAITVSTHPDRAAAHDHLVRHLVAGDYYLRTLQTGPALGTYELLALVEDRRRPRSAGLAVIEDLAQPRTRRDADVPSSTGAPPSREVRAT